MKLRYLLTTVLAALSFAACQTEEPAHLSDVRVSSSYVAIPADGGSYTVTVNADAAWTLESLPEWLKAEPAKGEAGKTEVKFSAQAADETREADFTLKCGDQEQIMKALQQTVKAEPVPITVKEALDMLKGDSAPATAVAVKGYIVKIDEVSPSYGNATYWIADTPDGTDMLQVYRGVYLDGAKFTNVDQIGLGDQVVVNGKLKVYNGTYEFDQGNYIVSIVPSLLKVSPAKLQVEYEASEEEVSISTKLNGLVISSTADWLTLSTKSTKDGVTLTIKVTENTSTDSRTAEISVSADGASSVITVTQDGKPVPMVQTIAEAVAGVSSGADKFNINLTDAIVTYVNGKNAYIQDASGAVLFYGTHEFKAGDKINGTVTGKATVYKDLVEFTTIDLSAATIVPDADIPVTTLTVAQLLADYNKYISMRVILTKVMVSPALSDTNRDGEVFPQDDYDTRVAVRSQLSSGITVPDGVIGNLLCYPSIYSGKKQLSIWASDFFTSLEIRE